MAISFKEKRELQASLAANTAKLRSGALAFKEKRVLQIDNAEILVKLRGGKAVEPEQETTPQNQKLADLLAGKYDDLKPEAYQAVLKDVYDEINAVDPIKPAIITYLNKAKAKGIISESAEAELLSLLK